MANVTIKPAKQTVKVSEEKWRVSSLYPEIMVSSSGKVKEREYQRIVKDPEDGCLRVYSVAAKMIQPKIGQSGNVIAEFYSGGKWICEDVAFLVAKEFVPNEDPGRYSRIKYRDFNKANLNASNLYWDGTGVWSK